MADRKRLGRHGCVALAVIAAGIEVPALQEPATSTVPTLEAPAPLSPRNASYDIDVTLDPDARTLAGTEVITWRNTGPIEAYSIRLHLYWNAFRNTGSSFLRQRALAGSTPFADAPADDFGYSQVTSLRVLDEVGAPAADLMPALRYIRPDDQNPDDTSLAAADLPAPVQPGQTLRLRVSWTGRFPRNFDRTGQIGRYFFVSQWFPKLGVFEAQGWTAHQFFANTEFYSDFGRYDVRITVPAGWEVGATGARVSLADAGGGRATHRYVQDDVHDFAWTTSPDFVERRERFAHAGLPPVEMRLLLQPEHAGQADRHFAATSAALRYYGEWYGPYPYAQITIVDPPFQSESGGMEYPTLFTAGTRWLAPRQSNDPEGVTVHEAGHQFWYGIVANNETEHAWLDEGLNEFTDSRVQWVAFQPNYHVERFFGDFVPWQMRDIPLKRATDTNYMNQYRRGGDRDAPSTPTHRYWPGTHSAITYHKTALWLHTLERKLGWETLQKAMAAYFEGWGFKHPGPGDFFAALGEASGQDLTWFVNQVYRSSNRFDYAIERFESAPIETRGLDAGLQTLDPSTVPPLFRTTVVVRRLEAGQFPVDVLVSFANGEQSRQAWDGLGRWHEIVLDRPVKAVSAQVDPERVLLLDTEFTNNSRTLEPKAGEAATKWSLKWMVWLQDLLMTYGFFV